MLSPKLRSPVVFLSCALLVAACSRGGDPPDPPADDGARAEVEAVDDGAIGEGAPTPDDAPDVEDASDVEDAPEVEDEGAAAVRVFEAEQFERFMDPELVRMVQESSGLIPATPPQVERLLLRADIRDVLRYGGPMATLPLDGKEPSPSYNAIRYAIGQELGCALQRWTFRSQHELDLQYDLYRDAMVETEVEARSDAATAYSTFADVRMVLLKHSASRSLMQLSCTESLLSQHQLRELSERVTSRL